MFQFLSAVFLLTVLDQGTKALAYYYLRPAGEIRLLPGMFHLQYVQNTGAAFGLFKDHQFLLSIFAVIIIAAAVYFWNKLPKEHHFLPLRIICCLIFAGALGNMIDRILHGYVIDFLYFALIDFPVFNVADIYVTVSCFLLLFLLLFIYREEIE